MTAYIGTLNESSLHKRLKKIYTPEHAQNEVPVDSFICDIVCKDNSIIEIQTSNLSSLRNKVASLLETRKVKIVFPIIENNYIRLYRERQEQADKPLHDKKLNDTALDRQNNFLLSAELHECSYRKSPKHQTHFSFFREITGFYFLLDHPNISMELLFVDIETIKIDDKKGRSPHKRPRIIDKKLLAINKSITIQSLKDVLDPILEVLPQIFSRSDIQKYTNKKDAAFTLWVLKKTHAAVFYKKQGRKNLYKKILQ